MHDLKNIRGAVGFAAVLAAVCLADLGVCSAARAELFPDPGLEAAVRSQVFAKRSSREPLVEADVVQVSTVVARAMGVRSLAGLEKCRNLAMLDIAGNEVTDLSSLSGLTRLQFLDARSNRLERLEPLSSVRSLQYLHLGHNRIRSLEPLAGLTNLGALYLGGNRIDDLGPLSRLGRLTSLHLEENRVRSVASLAGVTGLSSLSLNGNRIEDLRPLTGNRGLRYLMVERNRVRDLRGLLEWVRADAAQEFAPFLRVYLAGNPLSSEARRRQVAALREAGPEVHP